MYENGSVAKSYPVWRNVLPQCATWVKKPPPLLKFRLGGVIMSPTMYENGSVCHSEMLPSVAKSYPVWRNVTLCGEMCYLGK